MSDFRRQPISARRGGREKKKFSFFPLLFFAVILGAIFLYSSISAVGSLLVPSGTYSIEKGATLASIPEIFTVHVNATKYKLWTRYFAPNIPEIQAGSYKIEKEMELSKVFSEVLIKPSYTDLTITILPGWNSYDIDNYLAEKNILPAGAFLLAMRDHFSEYQKKYPFLVDSTSLEGFLYPDTYRILQDANAENIIEKLLSTWQSRIGKTYGSLGSEAYKTLILASIVEREERNSSEKPIVADILAKRIKEGQPMGADATVCYGYAKTQKQCTPTFISEVIATKHPYNTRNMKGYPPTPISTLSLDTWNAVLAKKSSPYYFYLHDAQGQIHYASTLTEHNANKAKYIQE